MLNLPKSYPEPLADLADCIYRKMHLSAPHDRLASLVFEIIEGIRDEFGGSLLYIPKGEKFDRDQRNAEILKAFDGTNHRQLAKLHGLGVAHIYRIVNQQQKPESGRIRKNQEVSK